MRHIRTAGRRLGNGAALASSASVRTQANDETKEKAMNRGCTLKLAVAVTALSVSGTTVGYAATTHSDDGVRRVHAGQSIQAAIDAAKPGDTIVVDAGVYRENLTIQKDDITLRGAGPGRNGTVLQMPADPLRSPCTEDGTVEGICIAGEFTLGSAQVGRPVHGMRLSGVRVRAFTRFGVVVYNAVDTAVTDTDVSGSGLWGFAAFTDKFVRFVRDASHGNAQGGFYVGDSPQANAVLVADSAWNNATSEGIGIFLRDASHGLVRDNRLAGNCTGLLALDTSGDGPTDDWMITSNVVRRNNAACAPSEDIPLPLSGLGIAALGTSNTTVEGNLVEGNAATLDAPISGGIVLGSSASAGGGDPNHTVVRGNQLWANTPADLLYDGTGTDNRLSANRCQTSIPDGLCG